MFLDGRLTSQCILLTNFQNESQDPIQVETSVPDSQDTEHNDQDKSAEAVPKRSKEDEERESRRNAKRQARKRQVDNMYRDCKKNPRETFYYFTS